MDKTRSGSVKSKPEKDSCEDSSTTGFAPVKGLPVQIPRAVRTRENRLDPVYPEAVDTNGDPIVDYEGGLDF